MINKLFIIFAFSTISSLSYAMEEGTPSTGEDKLIGRHKAAFMGLEIEEKWDCHNRLLERYDNRAQVIAGLQLKCAELDETLQAKNQRIQNRDALIKNQAEQFNLRDATIAQLKRENKRGYWKTIGVTFVCTVGGLAVLGQFINKKK